ncbi:MAG: hypothetical protein AAGD07_11125 [Planctomycetota bacterium]
MSRDLEEFLRRAAELRQQKAAEEQSRAQPVRAPRPYSDRTRERRQMAEQELAEDVVLAAEVVDESDAIVAETVDVSYARQKPDAMVSDSPAGSPAAELIEMLKSPGGLQKAFLMREILDRPKF